jgi:hypothetical protein
MPRFLLAAAACAVSLSYGHLVPNSLKFSRSAPYKPGDTVTVSFGVDVPHNGVNVDFSLDGKAWTTLKANMPAPSRTTYSYKWTVGKDTTQHGKIRICQMNGTTCTNADTTNDPSGLVKGSRYVLVSAPFSISAPTGLAPLAAEAGPSLRSRGPGSLDLEFALAAEGPASLVAFDARGRQAAVLLEGRYPAGAHRVSLFSEALRAHPEWVLRLAAGGESRALSP